ncbi:hypothetical protein TNCV_1764281 [Trichonephila clavipes]|nr:hypothetical protein TNCV_1764281 [Trichonephila clavipes]
MLLENHSSMNSFPVSNLAMHQLKTSHPQGVLKGRNYYKIAKINLDIDEDRRKIIDQVFEETIVSWSTAQKILTKGLHMRRESEKLVSRLLKDDEESCSEMAIKRKQRECLVLVVRSEIEASIEPEKTKLPFLKSSRAV